MKVDDTIWRKELFRSVLRANRLMFHPKVIVFMSTYNGQSYLAEQLDSIFLQSYKNWELWVSDDGSDDETCRILEDYQNRFHDKVFLTHLGPHKGFSANFLSLVCQQTSQGSYYCYCDQDDIWAPNKLQQAINWLSTIPQALPALYCARTQLVNENNTIIGASLLFKKKPGFLNALVQNIAGGNTMMFNQSAIDLLRSAGDTMPVVAHDWWTYLLVTGAGGIVFYDSHPTVYYRQHGDNLIGSNLGWHARMKRASMVLKGRLKQWNDVNFCALTANQHLLKAQNREILFHFIAARNARVLFKVITLKRLGIYRQTLLGNIGLITAALLNKI